MREAVPHCDAPVVLCVVPAVQLLYHRRYPIFLSGRAVSAQPGARQPEGHRKRDDHRRGPGRAAADPGIRRQQSSQQPGGLSHRRQPRQARPDSGGRAHCGRPPGHSPGCETVRHPQDHLRHPVPAGGRAAGNSEHMQQNRVPDPGGAGHLSVGQGRGHHQQAPPGGAAGPAGPEPHPGEPGGDLRLYQRQNGADHRRRRVHRQRAVPPDRPAQAPAAGDLRHLRKQRLRHPDGTAPGAPGADAGRVHRFRPGPGDGWTICWTPISRT